MQVRYFATATAILAILACGGNEQRGSDTVDAGMEGMGGMGDVPMGGMTMDQMSAHMTAMQGASGDSIMRMMPLYRQLVANMLAQFNREMSQMNMPDDPAWGATVDSIRQDLARMPELSAAEMQAMMPGHHARMMRVMEMHRSMMASMK